MTPDPQLGAILFLAALAYGLRAGGFVLARWIRPDTIGARLLERAPGNLYVAFIAVGVATGGWPVGAGVAAAFATTRLVRNEVAVLLVGAGVVAALTSLR